MIQTTRFFAVRALDADIGLEIAHSRMPKVIRTKRLGAAVGLALAGQRSNG
jgi:hypothetical protein